ncbi:MAG: dihydrodipicolinate synthase family protein [Deltaproteobacteria bacterium]|nr:dihydrodipicolinate synthase family protein [Deltaproteobacteria bacterium]
MSGPYLAGIIPATLLPMNADYSIAEEALKDYIQWLMKHRVGGLAVNVEVGEGPLLSREERRRVIEIVSGVVNERVPIIAGVASNYTGDAMAQAVDAREAGASAIMIHPNYFFVGDDLPVEIPVTYYKAIGEAAKLPVVLFQLNRGLGGVEYSKGTLAELASLESVYAIKEASFDAKKFHETVQLLRGLPKKISILTGNDTFLLESFLLGVEGALIGFGSFETNKIAEMFDLVNNRRYDEAKEIADRLQPLANVLWGAPTRNRRARCKEALAMMGVLSPRVVNVRPPQMPLDQEEKQRVKNALKKAHLL